MPCLLDSGWLVKWLGSLSDGQAIATSVGTFLATVVTIVYPVVRAFKKQQSLAMAEADKPVAPAVPAQPLALPPFNTAAMVRMAELEERVSRTEWSLDGARARVRQLEQELRDVGADAARTAQSMAGERLAREKAEKALAAATSERDAAELRARTLAAELAELKHAIGSGHSTVASVTPLRPPRPSRT